MPSTTLSSRNVFWIALVTYILIRALSFASVFYPLVNDILAAVCILTFSYACKRNLALGWALLVAEFLIDGSGHYFTLFGLLLRTWYLGIFGCLWLWAKIRAKKVSLHLPRQIVLFSLFAALAIGWAVIRGFLYGHAPRLVIEDLMLYAFFLLFLPGLEYWQAHKKCYLPAVKAFVVGSTLFSLVTLFLYSAGFSILQDPYYHWFRDVAGGKITDLGNHFFRIVVSEHLLLVPIALILAHTLMREKQKLVYWFLLACSFWTLGVNFTRIYFIALFIGFLMLKINTGWKQWLTMSCTSALLFIGLFFFTNVITSQGQSLGLELIGVKAAGIKTPDTDVSGAIRLALLPDIMRTIKQDPLFGSGLGTTVSYIHPVTKALETRTQFDWGYLEMIAELGLIGTIAYCTFLGFIVYSLFTSTKHTPQFVGVIAGASTLFVINSTTPALFQGFGVLYFVWLMLQASEEKKSTN